MNILRGGHEHRRPASCAAVGGRTIQRLRKAKALCHPPPALWQIHPNRSELSFAESNELMANAYAKLYDTLSTGLRFFTVYGPAGRLNMAYFGFTNKLREGKTIQIFNYGNCKRDFTYIDDIVTGVEKVMLKAPDRATGEDGLPAVRAL